MDVDTSQQYGTSSLPKTKSLFGWWRIGFISDYVVLVLVVGISFIVNSRPAFVRPIDTTDKDLTHPHLPNIVSNVMLFVYAVIVPVAVGALVTGARLVLARMGGRRGDNCAMAACLRDYHHFIVGLALAVSYTKLVTDFLKVLMGRFRPDFLSRCQYSEALKRCTGDASEVEDGRKSFPSGHASYSFAGCTFLAIYLLAILEVWPVVTSLKFDVKGALLPGGLTRGIKREYPSSGRVWRFSLAFLPLFLSSYVAISRLQQYIHHPTDVLAGVIIGALIAIAVHYSRIPDTPVPVPEDAGSELD
ncbi:hypothetical protein HDU67_003139 [Dinochytrium kinnereticum]|nr:hypothetical protein HDU67_003139 [Dinochytrium kinnereticum]